MKKIILSTFLVLCFSVLKIYHSSAQNIYTYAGGGYCVNNSGNLSNQICIIPNGIIHDAAGDVYFSSTGYHELVWKLTLATGVVTIIAGKNGVRGFNGDGILATNAGLNVPAALALDASGNLFIADEYNHRIRKVSLTTGLIITVAGNGIAGFLGDGGLAINARLNSPHGLAIDNNGNLFIADKQNHRIRKVDASTGIITTIAGTGTPGAFNGDGSLATSANLYNPANVAVSGGLLFIADRSNRRIRQVNLITNIITTVAGNGTGGPVGDGGPAINAFLFWPEGIATDTNGDLIISDWGSSRIRKVNMSTGIISTVAGNGTNGFIGDGGPASSAALDFPVGATIDINGNLYIADQSNNRIRKVTVAGTITSVAGQGKNGDYGPATSALLVQPTAIDFDPSGNCIIAERNRIRKVDKSTGTITTIAGINGTPTSGGDGYLSFGASFAYIFDLAINGNGDIYISDGGYRVRKIDALTGIISTVAGGPIAGPLGDGGPATTAFVRANSIAIDASNLYISSGASIRKVVLSTGIITTIAGNGIAGFSGDGGPATSANLNATSGIAVDGLGNLFISDKLNYRIRKVVLPTGIISTIAGNGTTTTSGDGGPAIIAGLNGPNSISLDNIGNLYLSCLGRIRKINSATGVITTVAGTGTTGYSTDGTLATSAKILDYEVKVNSNGIIFVVDDYLIRRVAPNATVTITNTNQVYDGSPKSATITTVPPNLPVLVKYNGLFSSPTNLGSYSVVAAISDTDYGGTASATLIIGKANQTITFNPISSKCIGGSQALSATSSSGLPVTFTSSNTSIASINGITLTALNSGTVTITASQGGNSNYNAAPNGTQNFTVNPFPIATISTSGPTTFCQGGSVTLTASTNTGYAWSTGATSQSIIVNVSGSYSVTVSNSSGCSATSTTTSVSVNSLPTATISASGATSFCQGGSVTLTASAGSSYMWSTGATSQSITANAGGSYSVTISNASGCSATSAATTVTVNPLPTVSVSPSSASVCAGSSATLTASGLANYSWSPSTGLSSTTGSSVTASPATSTTYTVSGTSASGCPGSATVTVSPAGSASVSVSPNSNICAIGYANLTANPIGGTYSWSTGATTRSITVYDGGTYSVVVSVGSCNLNSFATITKTGTSCTNLRIRSVESDPAAIQNDFVEVKIKGSSFYPNPSDKELTVLLEKPAKVRTPIRLMDQMGKSLIDTHFEVGESKKRLDTENLMEGLYLLVISDKMDFPYKQKVLIVHKP